jgi:CCR4-NOT transcription complex subunit 4
MWCWHNIRENLNGLCPACRSPYNADPHAFAIVDQTEALRKQKERRVREKLEKKVRTDVGGLAVVAGGGVLGLGAAMTAAERAASSVRQLTSAQPADRRHLHNYRVIQRNLVYVIGIPVAASTEEILKRPEYFGQYGKIAKIVVHGNRSITHSTVSVYITFAYKEDAKAAIQVLDGFWLDGHHLRASFGTTKYCNNFIRGVPCNNPECVYLHDIGEDEDRFTKEEIQAGHSKLSPTPGSDQTIVTGCGGPSGTGKRPVGETALPAPVFIQDIGPSARPLSKPITWQSTGEPSFSVSSAPPSPEHDFIEPEPLALPLPMLPPPAHSEQVSARLRADLSLPPSRAAEVQRPAEAPRAAEESALLRSLRPRHVDARSEALCRRSLAASFNGLGSCAVFPVPVSSLAVSVWNDILNGSSADLSVNPYSQLRMPVSELLELTLPPVDAACAQAWPKPISHYSARQGQPTVASGQRQQAASKLEEAFQQVFPSVKVHRTSV